MQLDRFDGQLEPVPTPLTIVQMDDLAIATRIKFSQVTQNIGLNDAIHVRVLTSIPSELGA